MTAETVATRDDAWLSNAACRALDVCLATLLLVMLTPALALIAIAIHLWSPGPVIFRQRRVGLDGEEFVLNKFRTMHDGVEHDVHREYVMQLIAGDTPSGLGVDGQPYFKLAKDARVTPVGRVLRRTSLDELPQLWNVLRGEMSLVGPRPPIPYEVDKYPPHWFERFAVRPGLTGLWQVTGRSTVTLEEMIRLDVEYVRRRSLRLNLAILVRTVPAVLSTKGAA